MNKREWFDEQKAMGRPDREWLPAIKLGKDGKFFIKHEDGEWDGKVLGEKFSAVPVIAIFQKRLWEGGFPNGDLVCGADKEGGWQGMRPHFEKPRAQTCARCPHNKRGDGTCKSQMRIVVGRIGKDKRNDLFMVEGSGLTTSFWWDMEKQLGKDGLPVTAHRLAFGAVDHEKSQRPVVGVKLMKEMTDDEFKDFVAPNIEKARETMKPVAYDDLHDASPSSAEEAQGGPEYADEVETGGGGKPVDEGDDWEKDDIPF